MFWLHTPSYYQWLVLIEPHLWLQQTFGDGLCGVANVWNGERNDKFLFSSMKVDSIWESQMVLFAFYDTERSASFLLTAASVKQSLHCLPLWEVISYNSRTQLLFVPGSLNETWYINNIIRLVVVSLVMRVTNVVFQQVNALPHMARATQHALQCVIQSP